MTVPPDALLFNMTPNPDDGKAPRSREEEARRQRSITEIILRECRKAGLEATTEPGCLDPLAALNEQRAETIKTETQPKLVEFTRTAGPVVEVKELRTPKGLVCKGVVMRGATEIKLSLNLQSLTDLVERAMDQLETLGKGVAGIAMRVGSAAIESLRRRDSVVAQGSVPRDVVITPEPVEIAIGVLGPTILGEGNIAGTASGTSTASGSISDAASDSAGGFHMQADTGTFDVTGEDMAHGGGYDGSPPFA